MLLVRNFERVGGQPNCCRSRPHSLKPMGAATSPSTPPRAYWYTGLREAETAETARRRASSLIWEFAPKRSP